VAEVNKRPIDYESPIPRTHRPQWYVAIGLAAVLSILAIAFLFA
jgi:hypothetical protein